MQSLGRMVLFTDGAYIFNQGIGAETETNRKNIELFLLYPCFIANKKWSNLELSPPVPHVIYASM